MLRRAIKSIRQYLNWCPFQPSPVRVANGIEKAQLLVDAFEAKEK